MAASAHAAGQWTRAAAIVPVGSLEQHGPHLPVEIDTLLGETVALRTARLAAEKEPVLVLPMRHFFNLHAYIQEKHLDAMGKLILVTGLVLTYFYLCEIFTSLYSGEHIEKASLFWKVTATYAWALWTMYFCNCVAPLVLFWRRARTSPVVLYIVSILVLIGMWFERFNIIVPSLGHDFYPYTWGIYYPSPTDTMIVIGSFSFFLLLFLGFIKLMPSLSIVEVKETIPPPVRDRAHGH